MEQKFQKELERLKILQKKVFDLIEKHICGGYYFSDNEGQFMIKLIPNYSENKYVLSINLYTFGPYMGKYSWYGNSLNDVISDADRDITKWINEEMRTDTKKIQDIKIGENKI